MSVVTKESTEVVAQSIGITNLSPEVSLSLAPDVREIMQGDGSQASSSHGQWGTEVNKEQEWVGFCRKKYKHSGGKLLIGKTEPRWREKLFLQPRLISFGPIHYGKDGLRMGETKKRDYASDYIWCLKLKEEEYIGVCSRVKENVDSLRQCYEISPEEWSGICHKYRDENKEIFSEFPETLSPFHCDCIASWMFLVDGFALLSSIWARSSSRVIDPDIFLLENQLPSQLLVMLMRKPSDTQVIGQPSTFVLNLFVENICEQMWPAVSRSYSFVEIEDCYHLLHVLWCKIGALFGLHPKELERFRKVRWGRSHNIQELKEAGIKLKSKAIKKPRFKMGWLFAELELPKFVIENETATILSNLIALEMYPHFRSNMEVTSYVGLLKSLVANPSDIAEMRSAGIIQNNLPNDKAAFELLWRLDVVGIESGQNASSLCRSDIHNYLEEHKTRIKIASWLIETGRVYFKTPWTAIAVLAATIAIILIAIKTYFAIFPRKQ